MIANASGCRSSRAGLRSAGRAFTTRVCRAGLLGPPRQSLKILGASLPFNALRVSTTSGNRFGIAA